MSDQKRLKASLRRNKIKFQTNCLDIRALIGFSEDGKLKHNYMMYVIDRGVRVRFDESDNIVGLSPSDQKVENSRDAIGVIKNLPIIPSYTIMAYLYQFVGGCRVDMQYHNERSSTMWIRSDFPIGDLDIQICARNSDYPTSDNNTIELCLARDAWDLKKDGRSKSKTIKIDVNSPGGIMKCKTLGEIERYVFET